MALLTGDIPPFSATGSSNSPCAHQPVAPHQDKAAAAPAPFSWSTLGSTSPFPIPSPRSTPGSQLCSRQPARFSAGKQGRALLVLQALGRETWSQGRESRCSTSEACSSGHPGGDLLFIHPFHAGPLWVHHAGHLEELIRSIQSYEPVLPKQQGFTVSASCLVGVLPLWLSG